MNQIPTIYVSLFAPACMLVGVLATKFVDYMLSRRKQGSDEIRDVNTAHANLNKSLQTSFEIMSKELARLQADRISDAAAWADKEATYTRRIQALEDELARIQMIVLEAGQGCPTCSAIPPAPLEIVP